MIKDYTEDFLCYKEDMQCAYMTSIKWLGYTPLSVFTLPYPENTRQGTLLDLVSQGLDNH